MKRILILFIGLIFSINLFAQPFTQINAGESGLSVRTNLNNLIGYINGLGLDIEFSVDGSTWHYGWSSGDNYMRLSDDWGSTWSDAIYLWDGGVLGSIESDTLIIGTDTITGFTNVFLQVSDSTIYATQTDLAAISDSTFVNATVTDTLFLTGDTITDVQKVTGAAGENYILSSKAYVDSTVSAASGYTDEDAQDAIGAILDDGTLGDIIFTYTDATPTIHATVKDNSIVLPIDSITGLQDSLDARITAEVDGSVTNEGSLTVKAGTSTTSVISSNTSGSTDVTLSAGTGITLSETGNTITIASSGEMVYPSAGIPISTGSAWGTSITDNSTNWNTAYGWGDHSTEGYLTSVPSLSSVLGVGNTTNNQTLLFDYDEGVAAEFKFGTKSFQFCEINGTSDLSVSYGTYGTVQSEMFKWQDDGYTLIYAPIIGWSDGTIEGAIRYDKYGAKTFEGYNGTSWVTFGGGSSLWTSGTYGINYNGNVGIGTSADRYVPLTVTSTNGGYMLEVLNSQEQGSGVYIEAGQYNTFNSSLLIKNNTPTTLFDVRSSGAIYMPSISSATTSNVLYFNSSTGLVTYGAASSSGSTTFLGLTDTPSSYTAGKWLKVNSGGTALEFTDAPSGSSLWTDGGTVIYPASGEDVRISGTSPSLYFVDTSTGDDDISINVNGDALYIYDETGAATLASILTSDGSLVLNGYGSGDITGTAAYDLRVTSTGKLIEVADGGGTSENFSVVSLSGTYVSWNMNNGINAKISLSGNTVITLSNVPTGRSGNLTVTNPSSTYTITFSLSGKTVKVSPFLNSSSGAITMSGGSKIDVLSWYYDGTYFIVNGTLDYD